jgi:hypothetical protein
MPHAGTGRAIHADGGDTLLGVAADGRLRLVVHACLVSGGRAPSWPQSGKQARIAR